ncbi:MAG: SusD/RagB family nutrient-binding outer membrane lipoprotein [Bacteroidota bacterium]
MKILKYILIVIISLGIFTGCDDFLGDNIDPDAPTVVTADLVMPVVLFYAALENYDHSEYGVYLSQCLTTAGRSQTGAHAYRSGWHFTAMNRHPQWRRHYFDLGANAHNIINYAEEEGSYNYLALSRLLRLLSIQQTTDAFGPMAVTTAYTEDPQFESQESVYEWMENEVEELIQLFNSAEVSQTTNRPMGQGVDRVFGGDMQKWKQVAFAIKARILLRNLPNMNTSASTCNNIISAAETALNGWEDPAYKFDGGSSVEKNCMWGRTNRPVGGWESRSNDLDGAIPTKFFVEDIMGFNSSDKTYDDPRLPYLMKARGDAASGIDTTFRYLESNSGMSATHKLEWYPDMYESALTTDQSAIVLLSEGELHFIITEAAYWAGDKAKAADHLVKGIQYHMELLSVPAEETDAYVSNPDLVPGSANITLSHIMKEKYKAMYLQIEQWTDLRRYAFSNDQNNINYDNTVIYPGLRRPHNLYEPHWGGDENVWIHRINYDPDTEEKYNPTKLEELGAYQSAEWLKKPMIWGRAN